MPVSWEDLLLGDASSPGSRTGTQRILMVEADIDPNSLFDAGRAAEPRMGCLQTPVGMVLLRCRGAV